MQVQAKEYNPYIFMYREREWATCKDIEHMELDGKIAYFARPVFLSLAAVLLITLVSAYVWVFNNTIIRYGGRFGWLSPPTYVFIPANPIAYAIRIGMLVTIAAAPVIAGLSELYLYYKVEKYEEKHITGNLSKFCSEQNIEKKWYLKTKAKHGGLKEGIESTERQKAAENLRLETEKERLQKVLTAITTIQSQQNNDSK
jgi:hypothetical protein